GHHSHFLHFLILSQHHYFFPYPLLHYHHLHSHFHHYYCFHYPHFLLHFHLILFLHFLSFLLLLLLLLLHFLLVFLFLFLLFLFLPIYHLLPQVYLEHLLLRQLMPDQYHLSSHVNSLLFPQID